MHPGWLSNAYVAGDEAGGTGVFVDSGAPLEPLLAAVERDGLKLSHLLRTHAHADHVEPEAELVSPFGLDVVTGDVATGGLRAQALPTPGHSDDGVSLLVNGTVLFSGDTLF